MKPRALGRKAFVMIVVGATYAVILAGMLLVGHYVTPPGDRELSPEAGGLNAALHQLLGRGGGTDFLVDYASAYGLTHELNPYDVSAHLTAVVGNQWDVSTANPHPPTLLPLVLPFTTLKYEWALAAWTLAMIGVFIATMRLMGVTLVYAICAGVLLSLVFPGAYGIGNPVPLIGLGVAIAYRGRDHPGTAGLGLALATAPKLTGLLLLVPFFATRRFRAVAWALGFIVVLAAIPYVLYPKVWSHYGDAGLSGVKFTVSRQDNAALLNLGVKWGIPTFLTILVIGVAALLIAAVRRESFWPTVWLMVASLPIAWMYSLLTFIPLVVWIARRAPSLPWATAAAITSAGLAVASPPLGLWPVAIFPTVVMLMYVGLWLSSEREAVDFALPNLRPWTKANSE